MRLDVGHPTVSEHKSQDLKAKHWVPRYWRQVTCSWCGCFWLAFPPWAWCPVCDTALAIWTMVLLVPLWFMKSPRYLAVVAFVPVVNLPSALDCFAATSAPVPIHTGTTNRGQCWDQNVDVLFDLHSMLSKPSSHLVQLIGSPAMLSTTVVRTVGSVDVLVWCVRSRFLRCDDCTVVRGTQDISSCAVSLSCTSSSSPYAPHATACCTGLRTPCWQLQAETIGMHVRWPCV